MYRISSEWNTVDFDLSMQFCILVFNILLIGSINRQGYTFPGNLNNLKTLEER